MIFDLESLKKALQLSKKEQQSKDKLVFSGLSIQEIRMIIKEKSSEINPSE